MPLEDLCKSAVILRYLSKTYAQPLQNLCTTSRRPMHNLSRTSALPLQDLCTTSPEPLHYLYKTYAQPLQNLCATPLTFYSVCTFPIKNDNIYNSNDKNKKLAFKRPFRQAIVGPVFV